MRIMIEEKSDSPFWLDKENESGNARLGLAESWLENLGEDIVALELAPRDTQLKRGDAFGFVITATRTLDLRAPMPMVITTTNPEVLADARLAQTSPYRRGWLLEFLECTAH
jgi:glycine cleavage system H lipoate-binding protein